MPYLKITDIDGKEHEFLIINEDRDVLISRGFGKFVSLKEMENSADEIADLNDEIAELKKEVSI